MHLKPPPTSAPDVRNPGLSNARPLHLIPLQTAWLEAQQAFPFKPQPMTLCAYDVDCSDIVDLTDPSVLAVQGLGPGDLSCPWEGPSNQGIRPPSWTLAQNLAAKGVAAIIVPSFAAGSTLNDINVVFWKWSFAPPHQVRVDRRPCQAAPCGVFMAITQQKNHEDHPCRRANTSSDYRQANADNQQNQSILSE
jgi:RES domain-containing protein